MTLTTYDTEVQFSPSPTGPGMRLETEVLLPRPREEVFRFFADAMNLQTLTPPWLHFLIVTPAPIEMRVGTLIDYRLRLHSLPLRWRSRIAAWEPPFRFVDEQVRGPYRRWFHDHRFEIADGGTLCRDIVDYAAPVAGWLERVLVRRDLRRIFSYRQRKILELLS